MIKRIKKEQLNARKHKDKLKISVLTALLSEITAIGKNAGNRETTESEAISVIKKFKKNLQETIKVVKDELKLKELNEEMCIYDSFLPKVLTEEETEKIVQNILSKIENPNIGSVMGALKNEHVEGLDMATANKIIRKKLGM